MSGPTRLFLLEQQTGPWDLGRIEKRTVQERMARRVLKRHESQREYEERWKYSKVIILVL
jgi:hypothetical protein